MPTPVRFLNCCMESFTSQQAWGTSPATCTISLIPDHRTADEFTYENNGIIPIWQVHTFTAGSFRFRGMITNVTKDRNPSVNPGYRVTLSDCREVLNGTKVIIAGSYSQTNVVPNVINAFAFWESQLGFGNSQSNDGGMPYQLIIRAVKAIVNDGAAPLFGGPLRWKNSYFTLDVSRLPMPPFFYKVQGNPAISLTQLITQICDDAALDWYVEVTEANVITIHTISRRAQLAYNRRSINQYADSIQQGKAISSGWEAVNDAPTSKLLFGSNVSYLYHANQASMFPYWGTDINGDYIYSSDLSDSTAVGLNASVCYDILGSYSYSATIGEIRIAMYSEQAWLNYISINKPTLAAQLGIPKFWDADNIRDLINGASQNFPTSLLLNLDQNVAKFFNSIIGANNDQYAKIKRLHQMIQQAGEQYMGRSYIVALPFIDVGFDIETYDYTYSYVVDTEGGYVGIAEDLLGMNDTTRLWCEASPGRIGCFATYDNSNVDPQQCVNTNTTVQTNAIYVQSSVNTDIKRLPFPCVLVHLSNPLFETKKTVYMANIADWISVLLNGASESLVKDMLKNNMGAFPIGVGITQAVKLPQYISIPLRSKLETYGGSITGRGSWYLAGVPGNTDVEQDNNLNPWSFGGYTGMAIAATAKLFQVSSQMYAAEFGALSFPGLPNHSLGQELYYAGSNISSIDVSVDSSNNGFTTNYRLRSFDPNIMGSLAKREEARLQRIGRTLNKLRQEAKQTYDRFFSNVGAVLNFNTQNYMVHPTLAPRTPHTTIGARIWNYEDGAAYHEMAFMTPTEALANIDTRTASGFNDFAMGSVNSVFRPFSTKVRTDMPSYKNPVTQLSGIDLVSTSYSMNPFRENNDLMLYSKGTNMTEDARALKVNAANNTLDYDHQGDYANVRGIGLKTPVQMIGYGFDLNCESVVTQSGNFDVEDRKKSQLWKAGPFDPIWDNTRGCWTFHDHMYGHLISTISSKAVGSTTWQSGGMRLMGRNDAALDTIIPVWNIHNSQLTSGTVVTATYHAQSNRFIIISANC